jgi:hypothetical protein
MVGKGAPHDGAGTHHHVPTQAASRKDHHPGTQPAAGADADRVVTRPLEVDGFVGVLVAVVLVGDVHVGTGVDVVADVDLEVADDVAAASDHAAIADTHHRIGDHRLSRHHPGRDAHVRADQGVLAEVDPPLAEDRTGREGQAAPRTEGSEPVGQPVVGASGPVAGHPVPAGMDGGIGPPPVAGRGRPGGK